MAIGSINYVVCPHCGESWQLGWDRTELMDFLKNGVSKQGKFKKVKCVKCKTVFNRVRVVYLIENAA